MTRLALSWTLHPTLGTPWTSPVPTSTVRRRSRVLRVQRHGQMPLLSDDCRPPSPCGKLFLFFCLRSSPVSSLTLSLLLFMFRSPRTNNAVNPSESGEVDQIDVPPVILQAAARTPHSSEIPNRTLYLLRPDDHDYDQDQNQDQMIGG
ncbi:hypothetical protein BDV06DRAFT_166057 [Aspergillus oleicola]